MSRLKQQWNSLSTEAKLGTVVMPIVLALLAGLVIPMLSDAISHKPTPERRGVVKVIDVETGVPLSDFVAAQDDASVPPAGMVLAAAVVDPSETGVPGTAPHDTDGSSDGDGGTVDDNSADDNPADDDGADDDSNGDDSNGDDEGDNNDNSSDDGADDDSGDTDNGDDGDTDNGDDGDTNTGNDNKNLDGDGDGVRDADDLCPTTAGGSASGCPVAALRTEPYGCSENDMIASLELDGEGSERCDELNVVVGGTTGSKPGDVKARADAVAAALHETRSSNGHGGRLEPMGVVVSIAATLTGFEGQEVYVTWSLRHAAGRSLPHTWLKNRPIMRLTGEAQSDTGSTEFWVPLPKRPHGPFIVRIAMKDDNGTPLTFAKTHKFD
jgi:hypothetical protein